MSSTTTWVGRQGVGARPGHDCRPAREKNPAGKRQCDTLTSRPDSVNAASAVLAAAGSLTQAAAEAGVSRRTLERWRAQGRNELEGAPFARLALEADRPAVATAESLSESDLIDLLEAQARRGSVRAIELLLARRAKAPAKTQPRGDDPFREVDELAEKRRRGP
jgi:transposase-like protein